MLDTPKSLAVSLICILVVGTASTLVLAQDGASAPQGIGSNAISEPIEMGDIAVRAQPFVRMPRTEDASKAEIAFGDTTLTTNAAYARLQFMMPLPDGSGRLAVSDVRGVLYLVDPRTKRVSVYLDLREAVGNLAEHLFPNEAGFLGFAFHPEFGTRGKPGYGKLYVGYSGTADSGRADFLEDQASSHKSVLMEWTAEDHEADAFAGSSREVLRVGQFAFNHNIGHLAFNPAASEGTSDYGALYICMGDGGGAFDPMANGQNVATPLATLLRINPLAQGDARYSVPTDNPFVGLDGALDEIWAYGLRHAQHFSFASDGRLFINDIGQNQIEEVNLGVPGGNYGWNIREGYFATGAGVPGGYLPYLYPLPDEGEVEFVYPIAQYDHDDVANAIGSGYLYEGSGVAGLYGRYVFSDIVSGKIYYFDPEAEVLPAKIRELRVIVDGKAQPMIDVVGYHNTYAPDIPRADLRLGIDAAGELYTLTKGDGWIRKLVAAAD